ncbi:hypothetical protein ABGM91_04945 [Akkermansia muciniphila]
MFIKHERGFLLEKALFSYLAGVLDVIKFPGLGADLIFWKMEDVGT